MKINSKNITEMFTIHVEFDIIIMLNVCEMNITMQSQKNNVKCIYLSDKKTFQVGREESLDRTRTQNSKNCNSRKQSLSCNKKKDNLHV